MSRSWFEKRPYVIDSLAQTVALIYKFQAMRVQGFLLLLVAYFLKNEVISTNHQSSNNPLSLIFLVGPTESLC